MPPYAVDRVLRYGGHAEQLADLRLPPRGRAGRPLDGVVLLVHGGFWRQDYDRHHTDPLAADLAGRGYAVASLEYRRLGGDGGWPETFDDVATAMDLVPALITAAVPGTVDAPLVTLGHSAGGHLVLWAAGRHRLPMHSPWHRSAASRVRGVVALAPVADLNTAHQLALDDGVVEELLGDAGAEWVPRLAELDPSGLPPDVPVVIVHGDQDRHVPLAVTQRYVQAVRASGSDVIVDVDVDVDVVAGAEHFGLIDPSSTAWPRVLAAMQRVLSVR